MTLTYIEKADLDFGDATTWSKLLFKKRCISFMQDLSNRIEPSSLAHTVPVLNRDGSAMKNGRDPGPSEKIPIQTEMV